jgi:hypothetical protein
MNVFAFKNLIGTAYKLSPIERFVRAVPMTHVPLETLSLNEIHFLTYWKEPTPLEGHEVLAYFDQMISCPELEHDAILVH